MLKIFRRVEAARNLVRTLENQIQLPVTNQSLPENFRDVRKRSTLNYASLARVGRVESTNASESDKGDQNHEDLQAANEALGKAIDSKDRWLESVGNVVAKQNFIDMAHKCVQPGYDYYEKTFNDSNGRMYNIKKSFQAASVFNVIELTRMNEVEVSLLLEKLPCFDFAEFTNNFEEFHAGLMKEFLRSSDKLNIQLPWTSSQHFLEHVSTMLSLRIKKNLTCFSGIKEGQKIPKRQMIVFSN